jgi:hypothetical protein
MKAFLITAVAVVVGVILATKLQKMVPALG